jgi:hypothetical protein
MMKYKEFIDYLTLTTLYYPNIRAPRYQGKEDSAVERVPEEFINLLGSSILPIIQTIISSDSGFCEADQQMIMLVGLQPAAGMYSIHNNMEHFCCTLEYFICDKKDFLTDSYNQRETLSVVIDFTSGKILSGDDYATSYANRYPFLTPTYGTIPRQMLIPAWENIINSQDNSVAITEVKKRYLDTYLMYKNAEPKPQLSIRYLSSILMFNQQKKRNPNDKTNDVDRRSISKRSLGDDGLALHEISIAKISRTKPLLTRSLDISDERDVYTI